MMDVNQWVQLWIITILKQIKIRGNWSGELHKNKSNDGNNNGPGTETLNFAENNVMIIEIDGSVKHLASAYH